MAEQLAVDAWATLRMGASPYEIARARWARDHGDGPHPDAHQVRSWEALTQALAGAQGPSPNSSSTPLGGEGGVLGPGGSTLPDPFDPRPSPPLPPFEPPNCHQPGLTLAEKLAMGCLSFEPTCIHPGVACAPGRRPDPSPGWLALYLPLVVASLSGGMPIQTAAGPIRLNDRFTDENKVVARAFLSRQLADIGLTPVVQPFEEEGERHLVDGPSVPCVLPGANVYATLPATTCHAPAEYLVVGAHYDTEENHPGANDNASGVALVLAAARFLRSLTCRRRHVLFVFFDFEEHWETSDGCTWKHVGKQFVGSTAFRRHLQELSVNVHSVHTVDGVGWDWDGDRAMDIELPDANLFEIYQLGRDDAGLDFHLHESEVWQSDHSSFRPYFPAVGVTREYERPGDLYHDPWAPQNDPTGADWSDVEVWEKGNPPADTVQHIDFGFMRSASTLLNNTLAMLTTMELS